MRWSARIEGVPDLQKALSNLGQAFGKKACDEALTMAADHVAERMRQLVPVLTGDLRDSIAVAIGADDVRVGPAGKHAWRAHFTEFGTVNHGAEPFIRPAFDGEQANVTKIISTRMQSSISRSIGGG